jgi:hypothetical protein
LLKGQIGDEINVLMAACAWNLRKWMVAVAIFLFWKKVGLFFDCENAKFLTVYLCMSLTALFYIFHQPRNCKYFQAHLPIPLTILLLY